MVAEKVLLGDYGEHRLLGGGKGQSSHPIRTFVN